jgi:Fe-S cluster assembly iron-binding protein IscA
MPNGTLHLHTIPSDGCGGYQIGLSFHEMDPLDNVIVETNTDCVIVVSKDSHQILKDIEIDYDEEDGFILSNPNSAGCQCENGGTCPNK